MGKEVYVGVRGNVVAYDKNNGAKKKSCGKLVLITPE